MKTVSFSTLYFKGKPITLRDEVPTGEFWEVDEKNFVLKKRKMTEKQAKYYANKQPWNI